MDKLIERGKRLWKNYRWTNEMYNALFIAQGGVCAVCGRPPKPGGAPLNLDHEHFKVDAHRLISSHPHPDFKWQARAWFKDGRCWIETGPTRAIAVNKVRNTALPMSVRGLLCPGRYTGCNRLMGRIDNLDWLRRVLAYLDNPPAKKVLTNGTECAKLSEPLETK